MDAPTLGGVVIGFVVLLGVFRLVELSRPRAARLPIRRQGFTTDVAYWAINPYITHYAGGAAVLLLLVPVVLAIHGRVDEASLMAGYGPLSRLPFAVQGLMMLVAGDLMGYWLHRLFHGRRLWRFHAVHHSSTELDWLSSVRVHPVNEAVSRAAITLPLVALGFAPAAAVWISPVFGVYGLVLHANVDWDFGRLRHVLTSPRFHRWHHADDRDAPPCNFAGLFPIWDILFGTFHMPDGPPPRRFGTSTPVPEGFAGQLAFPFRRDSR